jgi:hypothetical protein
LPRFNLDNGFLLCEEGVETVPEKQAGAAWVVNPAAVGTLEKQRRMGPAS